MKLRCPGGCKRRQDKEHRIRPSRSRSEWDQTFREPLPLPSQHWGVQDPGGWIWGAPLWLLKPIWSDLLPPSRSGCAGAALSEPFRYLPSVPRSDRSPRIQFTLRRGGRRWITFLHPLGTFPTSLLPNALHPTHAKGLGENGEQIPPVLLINHQTGSPRARLSCSCSLLGAEHRARHKILPSLIPRAPRGQSSTKTKGDNTQKPPGPAKATSSGCSRPSAPTREGTKQSRSHQKPLGYPRAAQMSKAGLTQQVCCRWK